MELPWCQAYVEVGAFILQQRVRVALNGGGSERVKEQEQGWGWGGNVGVHVAKLTTGAGDWSLGRYCGFNRLQSHPFCPRCPPPLPQLGFSFLVRAFQVCSCNRGL